MLPRGRKKLDAQHRHMQSNYKLKHQAGEKTVHSFAQNGCTVARFVSSPTYTNCNLDYFHSEYILKVQNNPSKHTALPLRSKTKKKQVSLNAQIKVKRGECI